MQGAGLGSAAKEDALLDVDAQSYKEAVYKRARMRLNNL